MQTKHILIGLAALLLLRRPAVAAQVTPVARTQDPTNWGLDMWARLSGIDLGYNGQNPAPAGLDAYGMSNEMTWHGAPGAVDNVLF